MSTQPQEDILAQQKEEDIHKMLICKVCFDYIFLLSLLFSPTSALVT